MTINETSINHRTVTAPGSRTMGCVLVMAGVLPAIGFLVLPAVGWPDSVQGMSAAEALPKAMANEVAFRLGYAAMVAGGILFLPAVLHVLRRLTADVTAGRRPLDPMNLLFGLALVSSTLRVLWYGASLTLVPVLDELWRDGDAATKAGVNVFYVAVNDLLSTVQEDIGVNIFGGLLLVLTSIAVIRRGTYPVWIGALGAISGLSYLISSSELLGIANGAVIPTVGPVLSSIWLIAIGVVELLRRTPSNAIA